MDLQTLLALGLLSVESLTRWQQHYPNVARADHGSR